VGVVADGDADRAPADPAEAARRARDWPVVRVGELGDDGSRRRLRREQARLLAAMTAMELDNGFGPEHRLRWLAALILSEYNGSRRVLACDAIKVLEGEGCRVERSRSLDLSFPRHLNCQLPGGKTGRLDVEGNPSESTNVVVCVSFVEGATVGEAEIDEEAVPMAQVADPTDAEGGAGNSQPPPRKLPPRLCLSVVAKYRGPGSPEVEREEFDAACGQAQRGGRVFVKRAWGTSTGARTKADERGHVAGPLKGAAAEMQKQRVKVLCGAVTGMTALPSGLDLSELATLLLADALKMCPTTLVRLNTATPLGLEFYQKAAFEVPEVSGGQPPEGGLLALTIMKAIALRTWDFTWSNIAATLFFDPRPYGGCAFLPTFDVLRRVLGAERMHAAIEWAVPYFLAAVEELPTRGIEPFARARGWLLNMLVSDGRLRFGERQRETDAVWTHAARQLAACAGGTRDKIKSSLAPGSDLALMSGLLADMPGLPSELEAFTLTAAFERLNQCIGAIEQGVEEVRKQVQIARREAPGERGGCCLLA
jgi:hypothetical protein